MQKGEVIRCFRLKRWTEWDGALSIRDGFLSEMYIEIWKRSNRICWIRWIGDLEKSFLTNFIMHPPEELQGRHRWLGTILEIKGFDYIDGIRNIDMRRIEGYPCIVCLDEKKIVIAAEEGLVRLWWEEILLLSEEEGERKKFEASL